MSCQVRIGSDIEVGSENAAGELVGYQAGSPGLQHGDGLEPQSARTLERNNFEELCSSIDVFDVMDGSVYKNYLMNETVNWIYKLADWKHMVTLTFRWEISYYKAVAMFNALIKNLGKAEVGKQYRRVFGDSYFSYVMGIEKQKRGVYHFHMVADNWIDYARIHRLWNKWAGFAWIKPVRSAEAVCRYIGKYIIKDGDIYPFVTKKIYEKSSRKKSSDRCLQVTLGI